MIKTDIGDEQMPSFQKIQVNKVSANKPTFTAGNVVKSPVKSTFDKKSSMAAPSINKLTFQRSEKTTTNSKKALFKTESRESIKSKDDSKEDLKVKE